MVVYTFRIFLAPCLMQSSFNSHGSKMSGFLYSRIHLESR